MVLLKTPLKLGMLITNRHSTYTRKGTQLNLVNIFGN